MMPAEKASTFYDSPLTQHVSGVFSLHVARKPTVPILIAAPHGGRDYPTSVVAEFRNSASRIRLEDRHVDTLALAIASQTGAAFLSAEAPRAMIDLNRAPDDIDWSMIIGERPQNTRHSYANRRARNGLGLVPRKLPGLGEIWKRPLQRAELDRRIEKIHRPYHEALAATLEHLRDNWGSAILMDLHSMPPLQQPLAGCTAPEVVIGDRFGASCDARISACALNYFGEQGRPVAHNRPYAGGYVLDRHGAPRRGIHAIQVEICRTTYLDAGFDRPSARLPGVARLIAGLVRALASEVNDLLLDRNLRQAAE
jgi:N-formylglutamate amidohydrolase